MTNPTEKIRERLAEVVEEFNGATDSAERVQLYRQITGLRADLRKMGEREVFQ